MKYGSTALYAVFLWVFHVNLATGAELKVLTAGAFKHFPIAMARLFEKQTGHTLVIDNDTAGGLVKRIGNGEAFDVAFLSRSAADSLMAGGRIAPDVNIEIGKIGVGVAVKDGAAIPDIGTVDAFQQTLLAAKSISFPDPASGGSAGIYAAGLIQRLGLADQVGPKIRLIAGDFRLIDPVAKGEGRTRPLSCRGNQGDAGCEARWAVAGGDTELHDLCRRREQRDKAGRRRKRLRALCL